MVLLELCRELEPTWDTFRDNLRFLTTSANQSMEPESHTNRRTAQQALEMARNFRDEARRSLVD